MPCEWHQKDERIQCSRTLNSLDFDPTVSDRHDCCARKEGLGHARISGSRVALLVAGAEDARAEILSDVLSGLLDLREVLEAALRE